MIHAIAERYEDRSPTPPGAICSEQHRRPYFLYGTGTDKIYVAYRNRMGRRRAYTFAFEGMVNSLQRRYRESDSSSQRERIEEYMSFRPCPACGGARLETGDVPRGHGLGGINIHEFTRMSVTAALDGFFERAGAEPDTERADRGAHPQGDPGAA